MIIDPVAPVLPSIALVIFVTHRDAQELERTQLRATLLTPFFNFELNACQKKKKR